MKCDICGKSGARNYYGIGVFEHGTEVGNARWGMDDQAARNRAKREVRAFRDLGEFVYEIKTVCAHNRREVVRVYGC